MSCCGNRRRVDKSKGTDKSKSEPVDNTRKTKTNKGKIWNEKPSRYS